MATKDESEEPTVPGEAKMSRHQKNAATIRRELLETAKNRETSDEPVPKKTVAGQTIH
ncbi:MAG: hypothetical protein AAB638_02575 [Patescibacteria group bacterium]